MAFDKIHYRLDGTSACQESYLWGNQVDQLLGRALLSANNFNLWPLEDRLGSIRDVINDAGTLKDSIAYDGFGNIQPGELDPTYRGWYAWTGRQLDVETALQYNHARWYDGTTGRWISQDPLGFDAGDSNLYRYVNNGPLNSADPSGLEDTIDRSGEFRWIVEQQGNVVDWDVREVRIGKVVAHTTKYKTLVDYVHVDKEFGGGQIPVTTIQRAAKYFWHVFPAIDKKDAATQNRYIKAAILYELNKESIEAEVKRRMADKQVIHPPLYGRDKWDQRLSQHTYVETAVRQDVIFERLKVSSNDPHGLVRNYKMALVEWFGPNGHAYDLLPAVQAGAAKLAKANPRMGQAVEPFTPGAPITPRNPAAVLADQINAWLGPARVMRSDNHGVVIRSLNRYGSDFRQFRIDFFDKKTGPHAHFQLIGPDEKPRDAIPGVHRLPFDQ